MLKLPKNFRRKPKFSHESDFGRRYGWFIEKDGERIGELDYLRWDCAAQFWHEYSVSWRTKEDALKGPDSWIKSKVVLRNRYFTEVVIDSFLASPRSPESVIAIRGASVSEELILRHSKIDT